MPLTKKGVKTKNALLDYYKTKEKADQVFYAGINKGTFKGVEKKRRKKKPAKRKAA